MRRRCLGRLLAPCAQECLPEPLWLPASVLLPLASCSLSVLLQSAPGHHPDDGSRRNGVFATSTRHSPSIIPGSHTSSRLYASRDGLFARAAHSARLLSYSACVLSASEAQLELRSSNEDSKQSSCTCPAQHGRRLDAGARHQWSRSQQVKTQRAAELKKRQRARAPHRLTRLAPPPAPTRAALRAVVTPTHP